MTDDPTKGMTTGEAHRNGKIAGTTPDTGAEKRSKSKDPLPAPNEGAGNTTQSGEDLQGGVSALRGAQGTGTGVNTGGMESEGEPTKRTNQDTGRH